MEIKKINIDDIVVCVGINDGLISLGEVIEIKKVKDSFPFSKDGKRIEIKIRRIFIKRNKRNKIISIDKAHPFEDIIVYNYNEDAYCLENKNLVIFSKGEKEIVDTIINYFDKLIEDKTEQINKLKINITKIFNNFLKDDMKDLINHNF